MLVLAATPQLEAGKLHMKLEYFAAAGSAMTRSVVVLALMPTEAPTPVPNAAAHGRFWWAVLAPPNVHAWLSWCHAGSLDQRGGHVVQKRLCLRIAQDALREGGLGREREGEQRGEAAREESGHVMGDRHCGGRLASGGLNVS